ncbi:MAG TPA: Ni,Fe-hydrogenase I large subunit, partial [Rhodobacteraceae bacterium]|nr:Ni,Fe-hydrogenase I large subunit [Paracoccaceae bacterium]
LIHMARMENGLIADYKILAPTEWNFHPDGVASQALAGLVPDQARALVEAIDPCVDFEVRAA